MRNNVKMTIGNTETVKEIEGYMQKIHERYGCYVEITHVRGINSNLESIPYERWTISTPFIKSYKIFNACDDLLAFLRRIAEDKDGWAINYYKKILAEEKRSLEEDKKSIDRALKDVETTLAKLDEM